LYRRLGGPWGWFGQVQKISPLPGFDPQTIQPIAGCYTNLAIPALIIFRMKDYNITYMYIYLSTGF
jgi:hypothetical protein